MKRARKFAFAGRLLGCALLGVAPAAFAVEPLDTFSARIGGYVTTFDTEVRANGVTGQGTEVDLNRDFGLDDSTAVAFVGFTWRPWEAHEFGLAYYQDDADATRQVTRNITFRDRTFAANSVLGVDVGIDAYEAYYTWWAASHENWALGPRVGLVWYRMDIALDLLVDVNGNPVASGSFREEANVDVPAVTLGGSWRYVPAPDWRLSAEAGYFAANIEDVDADVLWGRIGVEWFPWEQAGFSLDYTLNKVTADVDQSRFNGDLDFLNSGVRLGFVYRW